MEGVLLGELGQVIQAAGKADSEEKEDEVSREIGKQREEGELEAAHEHCQKWVEASVTPQEVQVRVPKKEHRWTAEEQLV